jgi:hypothetical protein
VARSFAVRSSNAACSCSVVRWRAAAERCCCCCSRTEVGWLTPVLRGVEGPRLVDGPSLTGVPDLLPGRDRGCAATPAALHGVRTVKGAAVCMLAWGLCSRDTAAGDAFSEARTRRRTSRLVSAGKPYLASRVCSCDSEVREPLH